MNGRIIEIGSPSLRCALCDAGAAIAAVRVRLRNGRFMDVALSPESLPAGTGDPSLAGRTVGPCCGRVRDGAIVVDGRPVRLTQNEGSTHLHGGPGGCAGRVWTVCAHTPASVRFRAELPDGLDGYPGNRVLTAEYTVAANALRVVYSAATDALTWLDMTNHVYWDLGGRFDGGAMEQTLEIAARRVVFNDGRHLPLAIAGADGAFDFTAPRAPSEQLARHAGHPQLCIGRGYNNAFVVDSQLRRELGFVARLRSPASCVTLTMDTDQPAVVLYSGGFLDASTALLTPPGAASPGCGLALEAQQLPDPFHLPGAAAAYLAPGETWRRTIEWRFES